MRMFQAYGLKLLSDLDLPELVGAAPEQGLPAIAVSEERLELSGAAVDSERVCYQVNSPSDVIVQWKHSGVLRAQSGSRLSHWMLPGVSPEAFRLFVLCQGLGVILQQRGLMVLHASAVEFEGHAIAFVGVPGQGKTTLAAAACAFGAKLLADDTVALSFDGEGAPTIHPAFGGMRLCHDTVDALHLPAADSQSIPGTGKVLHRFGDRFTPVARPLSRVYVLRDGPDLKMLPLFPGEALVQLCQHTYGRLLIPHIDRSMVHLRQASHLIQRGLVKAFCRPRNLRALPAVFEFLRRDLGV